MNYFIKFIRKNILNISLFFGLVLLMCLTTISTRPVQESDRDLNVLSVNKPGMQNDSGLAIDPENMPAGLMIFE